MKEEEIEHPTNGLWDREMQMRFDVSDPLDTMALIPLLPFTTLTCGHA
jgi:hypothetical protein